MELKESSPNNLSVPEAADFLRLKSATVRAWILQRRIPYLKIGRRVLLRREDLEALLLKSLVPAKHGN
jgi:excisionase family DNA binding protein